jgi:hypothetical protein
LHQHGVWAVNRQGIRVPPGIVVGFDEPSDADFFLNSGRGRVPVANILGPPFFIFHDDAFHFVREGSGEFLSEDDAQVLVANSQEKEPKTMLTAKSKVNAMPIETKVARPVREIKAAVPKRPAPAPVKAKAK